jgi:hypothetical protein
MQFRAKLCADDGLEFLNRLVAAVEKGEDVSDILPGFDSERFERMLSRVRDDNGEISQERLAQFRERMCSADGPPGGGQRGGPGGAQRGGPGGGNPFDRRGFSGWRYFVNLNHTIELENEILIAPGVPVLDQLDGDATGAFGQPRHSTRLEAGLFGKGIGFRLSGRYTGETRINGSGLPGSSDLFFDDFTRFDLRVFGNVGELVGKNEGLLQNFRVSFRVDNIFDTRRDVRDENGDTPINYQPFLIDPVGRYVGIDLRKLF